MTSTSLTPQGWTPELVRARLREAMLSLRQSRSVARGPSDRTVGWPDAPDNAMEAYGYTPEEAPRLLPPRDAISRMDEVLGWISAWCSLEACAAAGLAPDAGWIALRRAENWPWGKIGKVRAARYGGQQQQGGGRSAVIPGGNHRDSLVRIEGEALAYLARQLDRAGVAPHDADEAPITRGPDTSPGAVPRRMETARAVANAEPCGTCGMFVTRGRTTRMLCTRFNIAVSPIYRAYAPPGQPCWTARTTTKAS